MDERKLKALQKKIKDGKVTAADRAKLLPALVSLLLVRTRAANRLKDFAANVSTEDRLYIEAYGVWRRKEVSKGTAAWVRANPPKAFEPKAPSVADVTASIKGVAGTVSLGRISSH